MPKPSYRDVEIDDHTYTLPPYVTWVTSQRQFRYNKLTDGERVTKTFGGAYGSVDNAFNEAVKFALDQIGPDTSTSKPVFEHPALTTGLRTIQIDGVDYLMPRYTSWIAHDKAFRYQVNNKTQKLAKNFSIVHGGTEAAYRELLDFALLQSNPEVSPQQTLQPVAALTEVSPPKARSVVVDGVSYVLPPYTFYDAGLHRFAYERTIDGQIVRKGFACRKRTPEIAYQQLMAFVASQNGNAAEQQAEMSSDEVSEANGANVKDDMGEATLSTIDEVASALAVTPELVTAALQAAHIEPKFTGHMGKDAIVLYELAEVGPVVLDHILTVDDVSAPPVLQPLPADARLERLLSEVATLTQTATATRESTQHAIQQVDQLHTQHHEVVRRLTVLQDGLQEVLTFQKNNYELFQRLIDGEVEEEAEELVQEMDDETLERLTAPAPTPNEPFVWQPKAKIQQVVDELRSEFTDNSVVKPKLPDGYQRPKVMIAFVKPEQLAILRKEFGALMDLRLFLIDRNESGFRDSLIHADKIFLRISYMSHKIVQLVKSMNVKFDSINGGGTSLRRALWEYLATLGVEKPVSQF